MRPDLDRLYALRRKGIKYGLVPMFTAMGRAGPSVPAIRIAGTNGKGSTAAMLEAILRAHGLRTGLFTSPHLIEYNERFRIDGIPVDWEALGQALDAVEALGVDLTFFETSTVAAYILFRDAGCDVAVYEAGLGGRLDSTNAVPARLAAITSIGLDHARMLTSYLPNIAWEKAGIIPANGTVVVGAIDDTSMEVIASVARAKGSRLVAVGRDVRVKAADGWVLWEHEGMKAKFPLSLKGSHHVSNAGVAITLAALHLGDSFDPDAVARARMTWPGRFQTIGTVIVDGAHNLQAIRALLSTIREEGVRICRLVLGLMEDKEAVHIVEELLTLGAPVVPLSPSEDRGLSASALGDLVERLGGTAVSMSLGEALQTPCEGHILVTGSFYLAGAALALLAGRDHDSLTDPSHSGTIGS